MKYYLDVDNNKVGFDMCESEFLRVFEDAKKTYATNKTTVYSIDKEILDLHFLSNMWFSFTNNSLTGISIGQTEENMNSMAYNVQESFEIYNVALMKKYGKPNKIKRLFMKLCLWSFDDAILEHYILDRFGPQEVLTVRLKAFPKRKK